MIGDGNDVADNCIIPNRYLHGTVVMTTTTTTDLTERPTDLPTYLSTYLSLLDILILARISEAQSSTTQKSWSRQ